MAGRRLRSQLGILARQNLPTLPLAFAQHQVADSGHRINVGVDPRAELPPRHAFDRCRPVRIPSPKAGFGSGSPTPCSSAKPRISNRMKTATGNQWLTNGHLMRYCLARPDPLVFENGNGGRIIDYLIGTMDNLGYQVPYGDTGSWQCWNSEMICLDMFAYATGSSEARWAANRKRAVKNTLETHAFYQLEPGAPPDRFDGVVVWPLEPQYAATHPAADQPPLERCFDKISFREAMHPDAAYLLLDGLSNGGHKHLDGNSLPRLTLFDRIWLADNDYFKAPVKFHNSITVFRDGQSAAIPPYTELVGAGESPRYGYSRTRLANYAGADWMRTIIWLKQQQAFAVLDQLITTTNTGSESSR